MNFFDHLRNIFHTKKRYKLTISDEFVPYVVQRYLSFNLSDDDVLKLNDLVNCNNSLHKNRQNFYDLCLTIFPKTAIYRPLYIKSDKVEKNKKLENFEKCAESLNLTRKQLKEYLTIDPTILEKFNKAEELYKLKR